MPNSRSKPTSELLALRDAYALRMLSKRLFNAVLADPKVRIVSKSPRKLRKIRRLAEDLRLAIVQARIYRELMSTPHISNMAPATSRGAAGAVDTALAQVCVYELPGEIRIERVHQQDAQDLWAVRRHGDCLSLTSTWSDEPQPSNRTESWLAKHRFSTAVEAIAAAHGAG